MTATAEKIVETVEFDPQFDKIARPIARAAGKKLEDVMAAGGSGLTHEMRAIRGAIFRRLFGKGWSMSAIARASGVAMTTVHNSIKSNATDQF